MSAAVDLRTVAAAVRDSLDGGVLATATEYPLGPALADVLRREKEDAVELRDAAEDYLSSRCTRADYVTRTVAALRDVVQRATGHVLPDVTRDAQFSDGTHPVLLEGDFELHARGERFNLRVARLKDEGVTDDFDTPDLVENPPRADASPHRPSALAEDLRADAQLHAPGDDDHDGWEAPPLPHAPRRWV